MKWTASSRWRRRRASATLGDMCSSSRSLSITRFPYSPGIVFSGLLQHALERIKICGRVLRQCLFDLLGECFGVVDRAMDLSLPPLKMFRDSCGNLLVTAHDQ